MNRFAPFPMLFLITACGIDTVGPPLGDASTAPTLAIAADRSDGGWVEQVTGGGTNDLGSVTEWISVSVRKDGLGELSGMYEYANQGLQDWRYHGEPDCLAVSEDGTRAVTGGPVTLSQGPDAPPIGTRVGLFIEDNGSGQGVDRAVAILAGDATCEWGLSIFDFVAKGTTSGNYTITKR